MQKIKYLLLLLFITLGGFQTISGQYIVPKKPNFIPPVIDSTKTLNEFQYKSLYNKLRNYSDSTSTEIFVVIIPTTKGENIGLLAPRWGQEWEIGQKNKDNGVFILLAKNDRKIWISPGYGVEHKLTAGITGELIRNVIIPEFKKGDYYNGLDKGTDAIFEVMNGEYKGKSKSSSSPFPFHIVIFMFFIFLVIIIALSKNRRGGGKGGGGRRRSNGIDILDAIILSNMGRSSSSGWGSSGGGWSSGGGFGGFGGGGGFSGGGAGGSW